MNKLVIIGAGGHGKVIADIAMKSGNVEIGTLDRFSGSVVILGDRSNVRSALEGVIEFFEYKLKFTVCEITEV